GMRDGKRNGNVKPVPPHDPNKGTSQDKQQFSTNAVNNSNASRGDNTPVNGSSTIPTRPSSHGPSTPTEPHVNSKPINTSKIGRESCRERVTRQKVDETLTNNIRIEKLVVSERKLV